jgi:hypothetical protein
MARRSGRNKEPGRFLPRNEPPADFWNRRQQCTEETVDVCSTYEVVIPQTDIKETFHSDKIVLAFEGVTLEAQAEKWIHHYNCQHSHELSLFEHLSHNLYIVEVIAENPQRTIQRLWAKSPLSLREHDERRASTNMLASKSVIVSDRQVSVNFFTRTFRAHNPQDFRHLVYFQIKEGTYNIFGYLSCVFAHIGKMLRSHICSGEDAFKIIALVETTKKKFATKVRINFEGRFTEVINIEVFDKKPRCHFCFFSRTQTF